MADPRDPNLFQPGANRLIGALMGGDAIEEAARQKQELANLRVGQGQADFARKVDQAKQEAAKRMAFEQTDSAVRGVLAGTPLEGKAPFIATLATGYGNSLNDVLSGVGKAQDIDLTARAEPALVADGVSKSNAILGALQGKPLESTVIDEGYQIDNRYGASPSVSVTPGKAADIAYKQRQTANVGASAGTGRTSGAVNYSTPARHKLVTALGADSTGAPDPVRTAEFLRWQQENAAVDPQFRDGDFALAAWVSGNNAMRPETYDFGAGDVRLPASVLPEEVETLAAIIADRRANGLPELSQAQKRDAYTQIKTTGGYRDPTSGPSPAPPASRGVIDQLLGVFSRSDDRAPADRAKGNAGQTAATTTAASPPAAAIAHLRKNPGLAADFEKKYGVPAAQYLR